ncbi:hypothetical protein ACIOD1_12880 [Streptomyces sp. NPDC088097]|uniref:hypothetical protein n=1 Tax=Streptomyces sp. NPDC088097 TaxID=3365823 RepID=UPI00380862C8
MNNTATTLRTLITTWPDLRNALGDRPTIGAFGLGLRGYLAALDEHDIAEAAALRAEERNPAQLGDRPVPLSLRIYDTMRAVEAALATCAEVTAASIQTEPIPLPGRDWPADDLARRTAASRADLADPRRWRFRGRTPSAQHTALWLLARVEQRPGPFRRLSEAQEQYIGAIARGAVQRIEEALDVADGRRELGAGHVCACGGTIEVYGGAGATPCARCTGCGALWTERGIVAA